MPTSAENTASLAAAKAAGTIVPVSPAQAGAMPSMPSNQPSTPNSLTRGPLPTSFALQPDTLRSFSLTAIPQTRILPTPSIANVTANASAQFQAQQVQVGSSLEILVNFVKAATQTRLNFVGGDVSIDKQGNLTITSGGDGLTHGALPAPSDPGYAYLRDEFHGFNNGTDITGTAARSGIGELGWLSLGATVSRSGFAAGTAQNPGQFFFSNNGSASSATWLTLAADGSFSNSGHAINTWAIGEAPGWHYVFIFKLDPDYQNQVFDKTQKAIYVGLTGPTINALTGLPCSRPDQFIGVRFDTSTTSPTINDAFFTLEAVVNPTTTTAARHNTQGATLVTNVAPAPGVWHRLDIICNTAGMVTITLDGSAVNTLTTAIPQFSLTTTVTGSASGGVGILSWSDSGTVPVSLWNSGSQVTVAGFGGSQAVLNGIQTVQASSDDILYILFSGTVSPASGTVTLSGYSTWTPIFMFGNDDTAGPTANDMIFYADFFSFIQNVNLGPNAPGTPDPTKARYF